MKPLNIIAAKFLSKLNTYNLTIFIVVIVLGLVVAVFSLQRILETAIQAPETSTSATYTTITFDQATIDKIDSLKTASQAGDISLPTGRINPFAE